MGLLGSLARRTGAAALYGSGRLVSVVVPDSVTPWNLRRTATKTTGSLIGLGMSAYRKANRKKKATKKRTTGSGRKSTSSPRKNSSAGWLGFLPSLMREAKGKTAAPRAVVLMAAPPVASTKKSTKAGPRASTTKGLVNLSRRTGSTATPAPHVVLIHSPVANEPRFDKNAWGRGGNLRTTTDWDTPQPGARKVRTSRLARAGTRKARATRRNDRAAAGIARRYGVRVS